MRWRVRCLIAVIGVSVPCASAASDGGPGQVNDLQVEGAGSVAFALSGARSAKPACATWDRFIVDVRTPVGQAMFAYVLSAQSTQRAIVVYGTGDCSLVGQHETVRSVRDAP